MTHEDRSYETLCEGHEAHRRIGASTVNMDAVEHFVASDPTAGDVIKGLGGIRKIRFGIGNRGKRGGGRAIYFLMLSDETAIMLLAYAKNEQDDLSPLQRKEMLRLLKDLEHD
ncbi:hypothetical protein EPK99_19630 [Neorhizobium lilium]|uniref:Addiction module toxin RelE n=1 Tax=Neorhizobium lilium TaxID=2503024 RepID=A0A444LDI1_9HYPH|nr:hypothetical protein [Neorhizobium lilium]RWX75891.1 hypothetical protein EPK99_19630 [Neorhizobium lilium]